MDLIPCTKHNTSKICFIQFCDEKVKLICDQCLVEEANEKEFKLTQILSIQKILMQPACILTQLDWSNEIQISQDTANNNKDQILQQINQLELQIKQFQDLIANLFNNFKVYADKLQGLKQELISDIPKILDYDQLKMILQGLQESKEAINPDAIEQIQQQLNLYCQNIKKDNSQIIQACFIKKIDEIQTKIQQENKLLVKYEEVKKKLDQFFDDQQKITNLIFPNLQTEGILCGSKIASSQYFGKLQTLIKEKMKEQKVDPRLIYLGSRDGLNAQSFWAKVNGKQNLLMIFKCKSNYIFGAYSPCQWQQNSGNHAYDNNNSSFLFSQTHDEIYPLMNNYHAIQCYSSYGPTFGGGFDLHIAADFQNGYSHLGYSYKWDKYQNKKSTRLFGQDAPNITECEIFEIIF